jgi:hypothetical protein
MSDWSRLTIGNVVFSWRYEVPSFLTFVFQEDDLFIKREEIPPEPGEEDREYDLDELMIEEAGFRTTVAKAKAVLDQYGYTRAFFAEVYASFRVNLNEAAREILLDELGTIHPKAPLKEIEGRVEDHMRASPDTPQGDLDAFTEFLRRGIDVDFKVDPFLEDVDLGIRGEFAVAPSMEMTPLPTEIPAHHYIRFRRSLLTEFESLQSLLIKRAHQVPANLLAPSSSLTRAILQLFQRSFRSSTPASSSMQRRTMMRWSSWTFTRLLKPRPSCDPSMGTLPMSCSTKSRFMSGSLGRCPHARKMSKTATPAPKSEMLWRVSMRPRAPKRKERR